jgi:hypothetical protein
LAASLGELMVARVGVVGVPVARSGWSVIVAHREPTSSHAIATLTAAVR